MAIRIGIMGYGNLGRGSEAAITRNPDMELVAIFTRRAPEEIKTATAVPVVPASEVLDWKDKIDVMIICGGSATDLPEQTPHYAQYFNVVDSFDNHPFIPEHFARTNASAEKSSHTALISCGWDPGLFSLARIYSNSVLPDGRHYTFWGKGVSQGHSDAIRRIPGVKDARQYTIPVEDALQRVRNGENPDFTARQMHTRECFVVLEEGADAAAVEKAIVTMPNYFEPYDTTVHFISEEEMHRDHMTLPHGGFVIRSGKTGIEQKTHQIFEFSLSLESNPEFTSSILVACARAVYRMHALGMNGAKTLFDVAPAWLNILSPEEQRAHLL